MTIQKLDLRKLCRHSDRELALVYLQQFAHEQQVPWMLLGQASLQKRQNGIWNLDARMDVTDPEHSSIYVVSLGLIDLQFEHKFSGVTVFKGRIETCDQDYFHVPPPDYNPVKDAVKCDHCKGKDSHKMVDFGHYLPEIDTALWNRVRGWQVEVAFGNADCFDVKRFK